ncbi:MAG TPA: phospholipase D-like domain-containing protein [Candidatus Paceibacterota bacterium]|nr:phospholipase D-like domain-containing protein [Candidatus Paceibacterota bacterium]
MGSRRRSALFGALAVALFFVSGAALYAAQQGALPQEEKPASSQGAGAPPGSLSLIIEPQAGTAPLQEMIKSASSSIDLVMYEFEDKNIEQLLARRAKEGIAVRVILDNGYFGEGSSINEQAFDYLRSSGVSVHWSPEYFALTHQKTLVVDDNEALIMTFNLTPKYYKSDRDFGVVDTDLNDVAAIKEAFDSDWDGNAISAHSGDDLVWSPHSREQLLALINDARTSLQIYNEEMADAGVVAALESAAARGVDVEIVMTYSSNWKPAFQALSDAGAHIRTYKATAPLYIHAKVVIADGAQAFVGSENFSSTSLDQNRELGLILSDPDVVASLQRTFEQDRQSAAPFQ